MRCAELVRADDGVEPPSAAVRAVGTPGRLAAVDSLLVEGCVSSMLGWWVIARSAGELEEVANGRASKPGSGTCQVIKRRASVIDMRNQKSLYGGGRTLTPPPPPRRSDARV